MAQDWVNNVRIHAIIRANWLVAGNAVAEQLAFDIGPARFTTELNRSGSYEDPVTHYGASWQVDRARKLGLPGVAQETGFPIRDSMVIAPGGRVRADAVAWLFDGGTKPDDPGHWSWAQCLAALGLYVRGAPSY